MWEKRTGALVRYRNVFQVPYQMLLLHFNDNLVPRGPFCHAMEIGTPGQVQRHSGFEWLCKHNRLGPEPIRFVRTWVWACAEWREVRESRTSGVGPGQKSWSPSLTKRIAASGNEIDFNDWSIECVQWRHQILKSKTKEPLKVSSSSGRRASKFIPVYNFPAQ